MTPKDLLTLAFSATALSLSLFNFYAQNLRKRSRLQTKFLSITMKFSGRFDSSLDLSLCNTGDTAMIVYNVQLVNIHNDGGHIISEEDFKPVVLKGGEVAVASVNYSSYAATQSPKTALVVSATNSKGKEFDMEHIVFENGLIRDGAADTFELNSQIDRRGNTLPKRHFLKRSKSEDRLKIVS